MSEEITFWGGHKPEDFSCTKKMQDRFVNIKKNGKPFLICKQRDILKITSIPFMFLDYDGKNVIGGPIEYSFVVF